jgi:hypothetical protein
MHLEVERPGARPDRHDLLEGLDPAGVPGEGHERASVAGERLRVDARIADRRRSHQLVERHRCCRRGLRAAHGINFSLVTEAADAAVAARR